jgi:hypothetical protein
MYAGQTNQRKRDERKNDARNGLYIECQSESVEGIQTEISSPMVTKQRHEGEQRTGPRRVTDVLTYTTINLGKFKRDHDRRGANINRRRYGT